MSQGTSTRDTNLSSGSNFFKNKNDSFQDELQDELQDEEELVTPLSDNVECSSNLRKSVFEISQEVGHIHNTPNDDMWISPLLPQYVLDWFFPPSYPRSVQLLRRENIAIPACYLLVGLLQGISGPIINVYPLDLNFTEAQQSTISSLKSLPSTFKLPFGFLSDNFPLCGYRRKSYMLVGWVVTSLSMLYLIFNSDLDFEVYTENVKKPKENAPSVILLSFSFLLFGTGYWFADVMGDSLVAEKAKLEPESSRGHLQSTCYACRFFGLMISAPFSTILYSKYGPKASIAIMAMLPMMIVPLIYNLGEIRNVPRNTTAEQCLEIWKTVRSRAVWQPMGFVYLYNVLQVSNSAWRQFLKSVLKFQSWQINMLLIVAYVLLYLGILAYKYYFITWSWRSVYILTTLVGGFFSALQICLIYNKTFGIDPFWFALGDDVFADFVAGIQFLPTTIMMVHLCPSGSEGASYAMFTTVNNAASNLASAISTVMLKIWDVTEKTMLSGDLSGFAKLTILTTFLQVSGIFFVKLLPNSKEDLKIMNNSRSGSTVGGAIFLTITILSILYAIVIGMLNIFTPDWSLWSS